MNLHKPLCVALISGLAACPCPGGEENDPTPQTPTAFETRNTGPNTEDEADFRKTKGKTVKLSFTALTDPREWRDRNGKVVRGRLLAFEKTGGNSGTVIRDGRVRLLADGAKAFSLLPVANLSDEDQVFVRNLAAVRKQDSPKAP